MPDAIRDPGQLVAILNHDIALEHGAIYQYLQHAYALGEGGLGTEIINIARSEMRHLKYFGELVAELGGTVTLERAPVEVQAPDAARIMRLGVEAEEFALRSYRDQLETIDHPRTQRLLERIVLDEEFHHGQWEGFEAEVAAHPITASYPSSAAPASPELLPVMQEAFVTEYTQILELLRLNFVPPDWQARDTLLENAIWRMKHMGLLADEFQEQHADPAFSLAPRPALGDAPGALAAAAHLEVGAAEMYQRLSRCAIPPELKAIFHNAEGHARYQNMELARVEARLAQSACPVHPSVLTVGSLLDAPSP